MPSVITLFEHEELRLYDGRFPEFRLEHYTALLKYCDRNPSQPYYILVPNGIRLQQYVGSLQVGNLTLQVLPKLERDFTADRNETANRWRNALWGMLRHCRRILPQIVHEAHLRERPVAMPDLFFSRFATELEELLQRGLIKRYARRQGNTLALKGRLVFAQHIRQNLVHQERFYTEHQVYDPAHKLHAVLFRTLQVACSHCQSPHLASRLQAIHSIFPPQEGIEVSESFFSRLPQGRKTEPYQRAVSLARMILLELSPDLLAGHSDVVALLFDMNLIFEEYVFRQLASAAPMFGYRATEQESHPFWGSRKQIPDIVLRPIDADSDTIVLDTKWKTLPLHHSERYIDPSDLRQVLAYEMLVGAEQGYLVYPNSPGTDSGKTHNKPFRLKVDLNHSASCGVIQLRLLENDEGALNPRLGHDLMALVGNPGLETDS